MISVRCSSNQVFLTYQINNSSFCVKSVQSLTRPKYCFGEEQPNWHLNPDLIRFKLKNESYVLVLH